MEDKIHPANRSTSDKLIKTIKNNTQFRPYTTHTLTCLEVYSECYDETFLNKKGITSFTTSNSNLN